MEVRAHLRSIRITPRKVRSVADLIRGKKIGEALNILRFNPRKRISVKLEGLLNSAVANAEQAETIDTDLLYVKEIQVNQGATLKRFLPRAMGRASRILKRTSHVSIVLSER